MLGNAVFRVFSNSPGHETVATVRSAEGANQLPLGLCGQLMVGVDVENFDALARVFVLVRPDVVINCVGLIKQLADADDPLAVIPLNALLPHRLARLCEVAGARLIHVSTDCVFSGSRGMYTEDDVSDAKDLYGRSKYLGEVDYPHAVTLRTSIIGHELRGAHSLVGWFLAQQGKVKGYRRAVFSGLPTAELARVMRDHVIPHTELRGVFHVSAEPINKFDLLTLLAQTYGKSIDITPDDQPVIDRSLNSSRFRSAAGYRPPAWPELVRQMREFR